MTEHIKIGILQKMTVRYLLFLLVLVVLSIVGYYLVHTLSEKQQTASAEINIAGRQRMLAGRIIVNSQRIILSKSHKELRIFISSIEDDINTMAMEHQSLTKGNVALGVSAAASKELLHQYFEPHNVSNKIKVFLNLAKSITFNESQLKLPILSEQLSQMYDLLLPKLDQIVHQYQYDNENVVNRIHNLQLINLVIILSVIILSSLLVFRPMILRMKKDALLTAEQETQISRTQKMDALGKLTGGIAHDYNNMLGVILGYSNLLESMLLDQPKLAGYAHQIHRAGERGSKLTRKLLNFSRKTSHQAQLTNINDLLVEGRDMLQKTITVRIELTIKLAEDTWPIWIDASDLEDAVLNMSINAMHAMSNLNTGALLTISTCNRRLNEKEGLALDLVEGDYVELIVADTGCGMNEATLEKIFNPFFSTKGSEGTGLGLSQVFSFINRSNGAIKVHSKLNCGSQFILYFPRHHDYSHKSTLSLTKNALLSDLTGKEKILIVDDEVAILDLAAEYLTQQGYQVFTAKNATKALETLKKEHIDLMLSDIIMHGINGYQLAKIVEDKYPDVKIQLCSGYSDDSNIGIKNVLLQENLLEKPYTSEELLKSIRSLLDHKEQFTSTNKTKMLVHENTTIEQIQWSEKLNIGIPEIDTEHKVLLSLLNECIKIKNKPHKIEELTHKLNRVIEFTQQHFIFEEKIMQACLYPHRQKHKTVHQILLKEIKQYKKEFEQGDLAAERLLTFFKTWLINHIPGMDKTAAEFCLRHENLIPESLIEKSKRIAI